MKNTIFAFLFIGVIVCGCDQSQAQQDENIEITEKTLFSESDAIEEIEDLIRAMYLWHDKGNPIEVGVVANEDGSKYISYNLPELDRAAKELVESDFFTTEFISNFKKVYLATDEKLKNKEINWFTDELPPFGSGANPWCSCQDVPFDEPNPWSLIEIEKITLVENTGEFNWKWGNIDPNSGSGWNTFRYHFNVAKVDGKWKISAMEGFEFETFTRVW